MSWLQTFTGLAFHPMEPTKATINIVDIAHALSNVNRFCGHTPFPYSVAQHSVLVSHVVPRQYALWGLLHDASEAYINDIVTPVKMHLPEYKAIERNIMEVVCEVFGLPPGEPYAVKEADTAVLAREADVFFPKRPKSWGLIVKPAKVEIKKLTWKQAEKLFLKRFAELTK